MFKAKEDNEFLERNHLKPAVHLGNIKKFSPASLTDNTSMKTNRLILFNDIITVYSENQTRPINTLYNQNGEFVTVKSH
jgi:hypothetical protein